MVIKTAFPFSKSKIQCFRQWFCYLTLTNYVTDLSVPFHWKFCFFSTIAFWPLVTWFWCDFFIMFLDDIWNIVHENIADFEYIAVKSFVKFLAFCFENVLLPIEGMSLQRLLKLCYVLLSRFWFFWFAVFLFFIWL